MASIFRRTLDKVLSNVDFNIPDEEYHAIYLPTLDFPHPPPSGNGTRSLCERCLTLLNHVVLGFGQGNQLYSSRLAHSIFRLDSSRTDYSLNHKDGSIRLDGFLKKMYKPQICVICKNIRILIDNNDRLGTSKADVRITWTLQSVDPKICFRVKFPLENIQVRIEAKQYRQYTVTLGSFDLWKDGAIDVNGVVVQDNPVILPLDDIAAKPGMTSQIPNPDQEFLSTCGHLTQEMIVSWMRDCVEAHGTCVLPHDLHTSIPESYIPGRLIHVAEKISMEGESIQHVRIVEKSVPSDFPTPLSDLKINYLSLSHCWGSPPDPNAPLEGRAKSVLTLANHSLWRSSIPLKDISATALQAIMLCRLLGFEYIWIDSLCIIQDSLEDWQTQSATMGDIYKFAFCNLATPWSTSDYDGFLNYQRDPRVDFGFHASLAEILGVKDPTSVRNARGEHCVLLHGRMRLTWDFEPPHGGCGRGIPPLLTRAWVYQERLLARRMLAFTDKTVYWSCDTNTQCENKHWSARLYTTPALRKWQQQVVLFKAAKDHDPDTVPELDIELTRETAVFWTDCVSGYTECKLTKSKDRLIALSSIAKEVSTVGQFSKVKYLAGLWNFNLEDQLLWFRAKQSSKESEKRAIIPPRRKVGDKDYTAPTWSWASIEASVKPGTPFPFNTHRKLAFIRDADTFLTTDFAYGLVEAGYIRLSARLHKINSMKFTSPNNPSVFDEQTSGRMNFGFDTDEDLETVRNNITKVRWFPVRMEFSKTTIDCKALLVVEATVDEYNKHEKLAKCIESTDRMFRRLGYLNFGRTLQRIHEDGLLLRELGGECDGIGEGGGFEIYLEKFRLRGQGEFEEVVLI